MFMKYSDRDAFGYPKRYKSATGAGLISSTELRLKFNESNAVFADSSKYNHTITNSGVTYNASGKIAGCGVFDGSSHIYSGNSESFSFETSDWTAHAWFKASSTSGDAQLVGQRQNSTENGSWSLRTRNLYFYNSGHRNIYHGQTYNDDTWHHVAVVRHGTQVMYFFDGVLAGTKTVSSSFKFGFNDQAIVIGKEVTGSIFHTGSIDQVKIEKEALWTESFTPPA